MTDHIEYTFWPCGWFTRNLLTTPTIAAAATATTTTTTTTTNTITITITTTSKGSFKPKSKPNRQKPQRRKANGVFWGPTCKRSSESLATWRTARLVAVLLVSRWGLNWGHMWAALGFKTRPEFQRNKRPTIRQMVLSSLHSHKRSV